MPSTANRKSPATPRRPTVEAAMKKLREFHNDGRQMHTKFGSMAKYGKMKAAFPDASTADKHRKARQFADPVKGYDLKEFKKLRAQCLEHHVPLGTATISILLRVPKEHRDDMQQRLIENHWSGGKLLMEIHKQFGIRQRRAGKRGRLPRDNAEALVKLARICTRWDRLCEAICVRGDEEDEKRRSDDIDLSKALQERVLEADQVMQRLHKLVLGRTQARKNL